MRSFAKIKPMRNGEKSFPYTDVGKSCQSLEFLMWQICLLKLFAKTSEFTVIGIFLYFATDSSFDCLRDGDVILNKREWLHTVYISTQRLSRFNIFKRLPKVALAAVDS